MTLDDYIKVLYRSGCESTDAKKVINDGMLENFNFMYYLNCFYQWPYTIFTLKMYSEITVRTNYKK